MVVVVVVVVIKVVKCGASCAGVGTHSKHGQPFAQLRWFRLQTSVTRP